MMRLIRRVAVFAVPLAASLLLAGSVWAQQASPQAWDGQSLSGQPADVQASFQAVWGANAAQQWATQHSRALISAQLVALGLGPTIGPRTTVPDGPPVAADTTVVPLHTIKDHAPIVGDLIDIDQQAHLMYFGNGAEDAIEVWDVSTPTPKWVKAIHVPGGVAGIMVVPSLMKVFGGSPNGMVIVDVDPNSPTNGNEIANIYLGPGGTDELDYDPVHQKVYVTDVADQTVGVVDAVHNTLIKTFPNLPEPQLEQPRYNPADGMMYMSWRSTDQFAKFDPATDTLVSVTPIGVPCNPSGFAISATRDLAVMPCRVPHAVVWNLATNQLDHLVTQGGTGDAAIFNASADRYFLAASSWHLGPMMTMLDGSGNFITNVPTTVLSHEVGFDQTNRVVYTLGGGLVYFQMP
jgi:hypothetical protein